MPKQIIVLTDGETWEVYDPEGFRPEIWTITDEAYKRLDEEGYRPRHLHPDEVVERGVVTIIA